MDEDNLINQIIHWIFWRDERLEEMDEFVDLSEKSVLFDNIVGDGLRALSDPGLSEEQRSKIETDIDERLSDLDKIESDQDNVGGWIFEPEKFVILPEFTHDELPRLFNRATDCYIEALCAEIPVAPSECTTMGSRSLAYTPSDEQSVEDGKNREMGASDCIHRMRIQSALNNRNDKAIRNALFEFLDTDYEIDDSIRVLLREYIRTGGISKRGKPQQVWGQNDLEMLLRYKLLTRKYTETEANRIVSRHYNSRVLNVKKLSGDSIRSRLINILNKVSEFQVYANFLNPENPELRKYGFFGFNEEIESMRNNPERSRACNWLITELIKVQETEEDFDQAMNKILSRDPFLQLVRDILTTKIPRDYIHRFLLGIYDWNSRARESALYKRIEKWVESVESDPFFPCVADNLLFVPYKGSSKMEMDTLRKRIDKMLKA